MAGVGRIDDLMHQLAEIRFRKKNMPLVRKLAQTTHFNHNEIEVLLIIHYKATREGPLDRRRFRELMHRCFDMTDERLQEQIYLIYDTRGIIDKSHWVKMLSLFCRGTLKEKIRYAFSVYDPLDTGFLTKDMVFAHMRRSVIRLGAGEDLDENVKEMAEIWLRRMDLDRDGKISFKDYSDSVQKSPMLLEALGQVLPSRDVINTFLSTCFTLESVGRF